MGERRRGRWRRPRRSVAIGAVGALVVAGLLVTAPDAFAGNATTLTTTASSSVPLGGSITDSASLTSPTTGAIGGTITFKVYGPTDPTCASALFSSTVTVDHLGAPLYGSASFTPTTAGRYQWVASYSGDSNYNPATTVCGDAAETVDVTRATPNLSTTASPSVPLGGTVTDTATLSGGVNPTGTLTFTLFGPGACGPMAGVQTVPVSGNGAYTSPPFTPTAVGTYSFGVDYGGDGNNNSTSSPCDGTGEFVNVTPARPTLVTTASPSVPAGGSISDTATLSGGANPTGTVTFSAFFTSTCGGSPIFTSSVPVSGNGTYASGSFAATTPGTYQFVADYSGDTNNVAASSACGDARESVVVTTPTTLTTRASPSVPVGSAVSDTAALGGGNGFESGTITFTVFGPADASCTGIPVFTSMSAVSGSGTYSSGPLTPTAAGTYNFVAAYSGDAANAPSTSPCGAANESVIVAKAAPTVVTRASGSVPGGKTISDTAVLSAGVSPTGTITFALFGPNDATCSGVAIFTSTKTVSGNGVYPSDPFTATSAGRYNWVVVYGGDANNAAATSACGAVNESVLVTPANPAMVTNASPAVSAGNPITDTATLSGGAAPTGTITFALYGPNNATCSGTAIFTSTKTVTGNGSYTSGPFTPVAVGTYRWIAAYSGDVNNTAVTGGCGDSGESVTVAQAAPTLVTSASGSGPVGATVSDTATLAGGFTPTGSITFLLFGPNNASCTGTPIFTATTSVAGNGSYNSGPFTPAAPGTYAFEASYSGDASNAAVATACNDANESVVVAPAAPKLTAVASGNTTVGSPITDTATLSGTAPGTGTITFTLYGPNDATCAATPAFTSAVTANGDGTYPSAPFVPTAAGTYRWVAAYGGDANNLPATVACNTPGQAVTVGLTPSTLTTQASGPGPTISDTAALTPPATGLAPPTGSLTFQLYRNDPACSSIPVFTSTVAVRGFGAYPSGPFTPTATGSYVWVASYSGDSTYQPALTSCADPAETVTVSAAQPTITTTASAGVTLGAAISDTARLAGGSGPTGTITFTVFGPNDTTSCDTAPASSSTVSVAGNGTYRSVPFTPTTPGRYDFIASYSGDALNAAITTSCGDPAESVTVAPPPPTTTTSSTTTVPPTTTTSTTVVPPTTTTTATTTTTVAATTTTSTTTVAPTTTSTTSTTLPPPTLPPPTLPPPTLPPTTAPAPVTTTPAPPTSAEPTTTLAPTTTTSAPTTVAPPTTTTTIAPPATTVPSGPSMLAVALSGKPLSPAGAGVNLTGFDYPSGCRTAYFFFDGTRIGSASVGSNHDAHVGSVSAPGDAGVGNHKITTSCRASGKDVVSSVVYQVTSSSVHRSAFLTSLNQPRQISLTARSIEWSSGLAVLAFLLLAFPSQLFNSTLQENYEEVRRWFHLGRPLSEVVQDVNQRILFPVFLVVGGALYALLTPEFGLNLSTLALALGLAIAVAVTTIGFALPAFFYFGTRLRDRGQILVLPGTLVVGGTLVLVSRLLHFQPGYLYGVLAVFVFHHDVERDTSGRLAAVSAVLVMAAAFIAWVARVPLSGSTMLHASFWSLVLESAIGGAFVIGLESTLVGLLPMRFLDGARIKAWNSTVWVILFLLGMFTVIEVLIQPGTGYVGHASTAGKIAVGVLYLAFAVLSVSFWTYFRFRAPRGVGVPGEDDLQAEGDFDVR